MKTPKRDEEEEKEEEERVKSEKKSNINDGLSFHFMPSLVT